MLFIPRTIKALKDTAFDSEKIDLMLAAKGIRHYRIRNSDSSSPDITDRYIRYRSYQEWSLRRCFQVHAKPGMTQEELLSSLKKKAAGLEARLERWQRGEFKLTDHFFIKMKSFTLPDRPYDAASQPRNVICFFVDADNKIQKIAQEPMGTSILSQMRSYQDPSLRSG